MKYLIRVAPLNAKSIFLSAPLFVQFLYVLRHIWWGVGAYFLGFYFSLNYLNYLTKNPTSLSMILFGLIGLYGLLRNTYIFNMIFAIYNVFLFAIISLTFLIHDPKSVAGVNYVIEMLGAIWLVFRLEYDRQKLIRFCEFSEIYK